MFYETLVRSSGSERENALASVRIPGGDTVNVDNEGTAQGGNQTTQTVQRAGIGTAIGAIIGAVAGGAKGAVIGAVVGAAGGAGSVFGQGKDNLELPSGTELTIRASAPGKDRCGRGNSRARPSPAVFAGTQIPDWQGYAHNCSDEHSMEALMIEEKQPDVNTKSSEFKEGVEAGLNSPEDTKNWIAGNDLGQALNDDTGDDTPAREINSARTPLFMRSSPEREGGNAQDEKDATEE